MQTLAREAALGRATGAFIVAGFGTVWLLLGLGAMHRLTPLTALACAVPVAAIIAMAIMLKQCARKLPSSNWSAAEKARAKRLFNIANLAQWMAIAAVVLLLNLIQRPQHIAPAIGVIVGLHFFPLAVGFRQKQNYVTGALLVVWNSGCMVLAGGRDVSGISSFGTGVLLLVSVAASLIPALSRAGFSKLAMSLPRG